MAGPNGEDISHQRVENADDVDMDIELKQVATKSADRAANLIGNQQVDLTEDDVCILLLW